MKVFTSAQVKDIDSYTIAKEPVASVDLMERAAKAFVSRLTIQVKPSKNIIIFAGPGNNGGDALAIARLLIEKNYKVSAFLIKVSSLSMDCRINLERLKQLSPDSIIELDEDSTLPELSDQDVIIDGIFGSGLSRPAEGFPAKVIHHINKSDAFVIAIDIPSGLFGEDNRTNFKKNIIRANYTLSFQFPFLSFFFADNAVYVGTWEILDIGLHPQAINDTATSCYTIETTDIRKILKPREKFTHKGTYGHALIIAGSYGMMGAAILCARASLRGGAGLVTAHVPQCGYGIMQSAVPEALISTDKSVCVFSGFDKDFNYNAVAIGPGLGNMEESASAFKNLLVTVKCPLVIDADALNILAQHKNLLKLLPFNTILTPHPGEFDRLAGPSSFMFERYLKQLEFSNEYNVIIILKGYHTIITNPGGISWFNTTGNPGMASGGSGDVLTGLIVSLLAQGYSPLESAKTSVFMHGLAGDIALKKTGEDAMMHQT